MTRVSVAQVPFTPIDTNWSNKGLLLPTGYYGSMLYTNGDTLINAANGKETSKDNQDAVAYVPNGSIDQGWLVVAHKRTQSDATRGNGGAVSIVPIQRNTFYWKNNGPKLKMDFTSVGGTWSNASAATTGSNTVLIGEDNPPVNNKALTSWNDTSDVGIYKRYLNYGWVVEVDPATNRVLGKQFQMGRFSHEGILVMPDNKTVYMTDDNPYAVFFKFVALNAGNFSSGQLYAYKQSVDGSSGSWLPISPNRDSLNIARDVAVRAGATVFIRLGGLQLAPNGSIYLSEIGSDNADLTNALTQGGVLALHDRGYRVGATNTVANDYGAILKFNPSTNAVSVYLNNGVSGTTTFANPNALAIDTKRNFLVVGEDLVAGTNGRSVRGAINEVYYLNLAVQNPTVDSLNRFAVIADGTKPTGFTFASDNETMFLSLEHPTSGTIFPWNKSAAMAITPTYVKVKSYEWKNPWPIGQYRGQNINMGGMSGLDYVVGSNNEFWSITDRGANVDGPNSSLVFPFPNFNPSIYYFRLEGDSIHIVNTIPLKRPDGGAVTGLPLPVGRGNTGEVAVDPNLNLLPTDAWGIDCEGIQNGLTNNDLWISEEYGTSIWNVDKKTGKVIARFSPYPAIPPYDLSIDSVFKMRRINRGFECLAMTPKGKLIAIVQSPLYNPDGATGDASQIHRIVELDPSTGKTRMFAYVHEPPTSNIKNKDWKLGDMVAINDNEFLVVEHAESKGENFKRLFKIDFNGATPITSDNFGGKTLEGLVNGTGLAAQGIKPVNKSFFFDILSSGWDLRLDKPEGLTIMNDSTIVMVNDNDFGVSSPDTPDGSVILTGKPTKAFVWTLPPSMRMNVVKIGQRVNRRLTLSTTNVHFDSIVIGRTQCKSITLTNPGTDTLTIMRDGLDVSDPDFTIGGVEGTNLMLLPGQSKQVDVCFTPRAYGSRQNSYKLLTNIPMTYETPRRDTSVFYVSLSGTGIPLGALAINGNVKTDSVRIHTTDCIDDTLINTGSADLTITSLKVTGDAASTMEIKNVTLPVTLKPGGRYTFTLCGTPAVAGLNAASVVAAGKSNGQNISTTQGVGFVGTLLACASVKNEVVFAGKAVGLGMTDSAIVEVTNCGDYATSYTATLSNATSAMYQLASNGVSNVAPGATARFLVRYAPTRIARDSGTVIINGTNGAPTLTAAISARGSGATILSTVTDAPTTPVNTTSQPFTVTLQNQGDVAWTTGVPTITGPFATTSSSMTIQPNGQNTLQLTFKPTAEGQATGTITFPASSPREYPTLMIQLRGTATANLAVNGVNPMAFSLGQNYPNPFNPSTTIPFTIEREQHVELSIYNELGAKVRTLIDRVLPRGEHAVTFDASDLTSGTYTYKLTTPEFTSAKIMKLVK